jgi:DNA replication protein DnaC
LSTEQSSREAHGGEGRIRAARFPARKTLEEFDFTFQRSVHNQVIERLGQLDFLNERSNIVALGPPGTGFARLRASPRGATNPARRPAAPTTAALLETGAVSV